MTDFAAPPRGDCGGDSADHRDQPALSAGAVARRLGVAVETLRSWDRRYGLGPAAHRAGAHRRYAPGDVRRLEAFCRLLTDGVPSAEAARVVLRSGSPEAIDSDAKSASHRAEGTGAASDTRPAPARRARDGSRAGGGNTLPVGRPGTPNARGLARCAIRLDAPGVLHALDAVIARDGVVAAWEQTIEPALLAVGRKWTETGGRYVEVEHLLSWCVTVALHRVRPVVAAHGVDSPPNRAAAARCTLLACAPEEWHNLPLEALAAALTERDAPARMLGPAVPESALRSAIARLGPARVVLWAQTPRAADPRLLLRVAGVSGAPITGAQTTGARMQTTETQILLAGPGWSGHRLPGVSILTSLGEAVEVCIHGRRPESR